jgi:hypothetical protein
VVYNSKCGVLLAHHKVLKLPSLLRERVFFGIEASAEGGSIVFDSRMC